MAQKVTVQLVDDLDDTPIGAGDGRTVEFAFDGATYEIDLSNDHVDAFREVLSDYIAAARKVGARRSGSGSGSTKTPAKRGNSADLAKIREWAQENGHNVSSRGRISAAVQEAYAAAH
ncbi:MULTISPECIES: Lsr2 family protein [unclassified Curtobacterium]|uniref:histone-like nucleoid-structuring protein Lsr2 n=1 Tax=unclassified Curtobacterium TaxID=257496 RepID=UPI000DAA5D12|nr:MULTISPECIES: Lsr2 family protein [unclassified Curtobacterium]PZE28950.1 Lsr2 family protein [Curtobacterium sp. MCBD17_028]PZE73721.1 Lsr2 family protein [Curtobacterium sp. MCBD17_019]PZF57540.1 Lsr2 family protein [Curtobacterium sp. MCBD17_034]PZF65333.1 Lsr2 family protein [Curtobacterium sp. MCBD17_013]PZM33632.1 Lsr2 family protein [Curtobacterium sp. MCBD17_031]